MYSILLIGLIILIFLIFFYYLLNRNRFTKESISPGKRVCITGASSGIGEQMAYFYSRFQVSLMLADFRSKPLHIVAEQCRRLGANQVEIFTGDLSIPQNCSQLAKEIETKLHGLDHLILNHALLTCFLWTGSDENMSTLRRQMNVNFISYVEITSNCLPMLKASRGCIGVTSAGASKIPTVYGGSYAATKAALHCFFSALRQELNRATNNGISITIAILGFIGTESAKDVLKSQFKKTVRRLPKPEAVDKTAETIVKAVATRKPELYYPLDVWFKCQIHSLIPVALESMAATALFEAAEKDKYLQT